MPPAAPAPASRPSGSRSSRARCGRSSAASERAVRRGRDLRGPAGHAAPDGRGGADAGCAGRSGRRCAPRSSSSASRARARGAPARWATPSSPSSKTSFAWPRTDRGRFPGCGPGKCSTSDQSAPHDLLGDSQRPLHCRSLKEPRAVARQVVAGEDALPDLQRPLRAAPPARTHGGPSCPCPSRAPSGR